jgi:hypothetical protein
MRQGDPLSPMLFIIVMDVLNSLISKASERGLLQPIFRRGNGKWVSLYTDDVCSYSRIGMNYPWLKKFSRFLELHLGW